MSVRDLAIGFAVAWWLLRKKCECPDAAIATATQTCPNDPTDQYGNGNHTPYTVGAVPCGGCPPSGGTDLLRYPGCG